MLNKKILIVEDDAVLRDVLKEKLLQKGYNVSTVGDGEQAMQTIVKDKPDLMLLDILMPRKGGMEVMEEMHNDPNLSTIPVIVISNSGQPVEIRRAKELGAREFLIKAVFDPKEVIEKVKKILGGSEESSVAMGGGSSVASAVEKDDSEDDDEAIQVVELDDEEVKNEAFSTKTVPSDTAKRGGMRKILIVEDDKFLRELFVRKMFNAGFDVDSAVDADQAFSVLANKKPEIILLDLILPGLDGFGILAKLKADANLKDIPVIVISNLGQKEEMDRAMGLGAVDFLIKANYTLDEIINRILTILAK
jgi:CheY-like chemotaxis protein